MSVWVPLLTGTLGFVWPRVLPGTLNTPVFCLLMFPHFCVCSNVCVLSCLWHKVSSFNFFSGWFVCFQVSQPTILPSEFGNYTEDVKGSITVCTGLSHESPPSLLPLSLVQTLKSSCLFSLSMWFHIFSGLASFSFSFRELVKEILLNKYSALLEREGFWWIKFSPHQYV